MKSESEQPVSARHRTIQFLSVLIAFCGTMAIYRYFTQPPKYHPKYQTLAHRCLDTESKYVSIPDDSYQLLDDVITAVKSTATYDPTLVKPKDREEQLLKIFSTIDKVLIQNNFIFPPGEWTSSLGEALEDHHLSPNEIEAALAKPHNARRTFQIKDHAEENFHFMSCVPAAYFYMGVAQSLGFELKPVMLPQHVFVRAQIDKDKWINWDPNRGRSITDAEYIRDWGVEPWQIQQGVYMHPLSPAETDSQIYTSIGCYLSCHEEFRGAGPAIECFRRALALDPHNVDAAGCLSCELLFQPDPDAETKNEAMDLAQKDVAAQPDDPNSHLNLAYAWAADGQTAKAVDEVKTAIQLDPNNKRATWLLPKIQAGETLYDAIKSDGPFMFWIEYERGWITILIITAAGFACLIAGCLLHQLLRRHRASFSNELASALR